MADKKPVKPPVPEARKMVRSRAMARMASYDSSATIKIKINTGQVVQDLHNRVNPKTARWHTTHHFLIHITYTIVVTIFFAIVTYPLWWILSLFIGLWAYLPWLFSVPLVAVAFLLFMRYRYYNSLKVRKSSDKGVSLGTSYQHYINAFHYSTAIGGEGNKEEKPIMVGETKEFILDYAGEPNPHAIILGGSGSGKTTTLRAFLVRAALQYDLKFLIIDWNGESEGWATKINATVWKAGKQFKINPFALRDASVADRAGSIAELFQFGAKLTPLQSNMIRSIVLKRYQKGETPTLMDIWKEISSITTDRTQTSQKREYAEWIDQRLRTVQRVFGTEPEEFWDGMLARNNIISLAGLNEGEKSTVAYAVFQRIVEFFNKQPELNQKQRLMLVLDEAWAVLQSQKLGDQVYESLPSRIVRLGRKYGFGMIVSTQQMEDIPRPFINSSAIRVIHCYKDENFLNGAKEMFGLGDFESAYLGTAGIGEAFVFDQALAQKGQNFGDYVKVRPAEDSELQKLAAQAKAYQPKILDEPELPIDMGEVGEKPEKTGPKILHWPPPADRPTPTQYAALLAIYNNRGRKKVELAKSLKESGVVTSDHTIYGSKGRPGIFETLMKLKLAEENEGVFSLTDKGLRWVDPPLILEPDKDRIGSAMHERILVAAIKELQKKQMLVVVPAPESSELAECIDLIAYPVDEKRKYLWDDGKRTGYEIQTAAVKENVMGHAGRADKYGIPLTWVSYDAGVLDAIRKLRGEKDGYLVVRI